jgi:hypothetical protein
MIRWCTPLVIVLGVLVVASLRLGRHAPRRAVVPETEASSESEKASTRAPDRNEPPHPAWPRRAPPAKRERTALARLRGRVLLAPDRGEPEDLGDLEVDAEDGERFVVAELSPGGHFAFHLPPGRYTLVATSGDLAGMAVGVPARADRELEIDIPLGPAARIAGTARAPADAEIMVKATPAGGTRVVLSQPVEGGAFTLRGLIPGRRYDLTFFGDAIRSATLRSIAAPTDTLEVALTGLPIVRGAIGFLDGACPVDAVSLHGSGISEDDAPSAEVDGACRFELTAPEGASEPTVVATGPGWRLEDSVSLPPQGDPEPICLNPPCRSDQLEPPGQPLIAF